MEYNKSNFSSVSSIFSPSPLRAPFMCNENFYNTLVYIYAVIIIGGL